MGNNNESKKDKLFEDTIDLYTKKNSLLINLFLKIYENKEVLYNRLIKVFYDINEEENADRDTELNKDLVNFNTIYSKAEQIVEEKKYNPIYFYGIIFRYLHYYDKVNFAKKTEKLSEGNADNLYEIY